MAATVTLQQTANWAYAFLVGRPTIGVGQFGGSSAFEPALTSANYVMQTILSAPFKWEWNRTIAAGAITTVAGTSDYPINLPNFGYLEKATLIDAAPVGNTPPNFELEVYRDISKDGKQNAPRKIGVLLDNNAGIITFRLFPVPDKVYTVDLIYQNAPILATSIGLTTWAPIPDKYEFLYSRGFLAQMQMIYNQQLALSNMEVFFRQLVGAAEGLTETEKNIFLADALRSIKMQAAEVTGIQQGRQARL